jgi:hypothetical protein
MSGRLNDPRQVFPDAALRTRYSSEVIPC